MPVKAPEFSESTWIGATVSVGSLLCGIVGAGALVWNQPLILLALAAGSGWALSIVFAVLYASARKQTVSLEGDLAAVRHQAQEWSATSNNVAQAVKSVLDLVGNAPAPARRRTRARGHQGDANDAG